MGETWGEEAPAAVAAALPHYAQVKNILLGPESYELYYLSKRGQLWKDLVEGLLS